MTRVQNLEDLIPAILSHAPCSLDEFVSAWSPPAGIKFFGEVHRSRSPQYRKTGLREHRPPYDHIIHQGGRHEHAGTMGTV